VVFVSRQARSIRNSLSWWCGSGACSRALSTVARRAVGALRPAAGRCRGRLLDPGERLLAHEGGVGAGVVAGNSSREPRVWPSWRCWPERRRGWPAWYRSRERCHCFRRCHRVWGAQVKLRGRSGVLTLRGACAALRLQSGWAGPSHVSRSGAWWRSNGVCGSSGLPQIAHSALPLATIASQRRRSRWCEAPYPRCVVDRRRRSRLSSRSRLQRSQ
jgi:hypothetical protein